MRYNIVLDDDHERLIEEFGRRHGMMATTGRKTGEVNRSAVIQYAIEHLALIEQVKAIQVENGKTKPGAIV